MSGAPRRVEIAPSILAADWSRIGEQVREAEAAGADAISLDVMDGSFVPPITFGAQMCEAVRAAVPLPIEAHLMVSAPERHVDDFLAAGADIVTIHVESTGRPLDLLRRIRAAGAEPALTLKPATPLSALDGLLGECARVQVMSVEPGWGGQRFMPEALDRIRALRRRLAAEGNAEAVIMVDGGVNAETAPAAVEAGAGYLVAGSAVFNEREPAAEAMARLRAAIASAGFTSAGSGRG